MCDGPQAGARVPHPLGTPKGWGTDHDSKGTSSVMVIARTVLPPPFAGRQRMGHPRDVGLRDESEHHGASLVTRWWVGAGDLVNASGLVDAAGPQAGAVRL